MVLEQRKAQKLSEIEREHREELEAEKLALKRKLEIEKEKFRRENDDELEALKRNTGSSSVEVQQAAQNVTVVVLSQENLRGVYREEREAQKQENLREVTKQNQDHAEQMSKLMR